MKRLMVERLSINKISIINAWRIVSLIYEILYPKISPRLYTLLLSASLIKALLLAC